MSVHRTIACVAPARGAGPAATAQKPLPIRQLGWVERTSTDSSERREALGA